MHSRLGLDKAVHLEKLLCTQFVAAAYACSRDCPCDAWIGSYLLLLAIQLFHVKFVFTIRATVYQHGWALCSVEHNYALTGTFVTG